MARGVPSHDAYAERVVASAAVLDPAAIPELTRYLEPEDFYLPPCREIWRAVVAIDAEGREVALDAVASWLHEHGKLQGIGGLPAIAEIIDATPAIASAHEYARAVAERAAVRRTGEAAARIAAEAMATVDSPRAWLQESERRIAEVVDIGRISERDPAATARQVAMDVHRSVLDRVAKARSGEEGAPGLSTGFAGLDRLIGRLQFGTKTTLGAATGIGKTGLALAIALNVARAGHGVAYATLELPREELLERALASVSRIPCDDLFAGRVRDDQQGVLASAVAELARLPIVIDDATNHSLATLRGLVRRSEAKLEMRVDLLVVDYLQLVRVPGRRGATENDLIGEASKGLLAIAKELGIAVLDTSQFNREFRHRADKAPQITDLRGSGQIEQDARAIVLLHRTSEDEDDPQTFNAVVPKARGGGRLGTTGLVLRRSTATWAGRASDNYAEPTGRGGRWAPPERRSPSPRPWNERGETDDGFGIPDGFGGL